MNTKSKYLLTVKGKDIIDPSSDVKNPYLYKYIRNIVKSIKNVMAKYNIKKSHIKLIGAEGNDYWFHYMWDKSVEKPTKRVYDYSNAICKKLNRLSPPFGYGIQKLIIERQDVELN